MTRSTTKRYNSTPSVERNFFWSAQQPRHNPHFLLVKIAAILPQGFWSDFLSSAAVTSTPSFFFLLWHGLWPIAAAPPHGFRSEFSSLCSSHVATPSFHTVYDQSLQLHITAFEATSSHLSAAVTSFDSLLCLPRHGLWQIAAILHHHHHDRFRGNFFSFVCSSHLTTLLPWQDLRSVATNLHHRFKSISSHLSAAVVITPSSSRDTVRDN